MNRRFLLLIVRGRRPLLDLCALVALCATACTAGCSQGPSRVKPPSIDADGAASEAMEMYDKDGDGKIAGDELDAAVGLKAAMATLDANKDGAVQEEEITSRIESWQDSGVGIVMLSFGVWMDGKPLQGAKVEFEPEPFLGDDIQAAVGYSSPVGVAVVSIPKDKRPAADTPPGVQLGFFRVKISKKEGGKEALPAKYNAETTLGKEVAPDDPEIMEQKLRFDLTTK
jgi:hypothetical protein